MSVEDESALSDEGAYDEIENEELEGVDDEGEGNADEDSEALAGAADGDGQTPQGRQEGQVRQPSRSERRVEQALKEAKEAREDAARLRAEMQQRQAAPQETAAQRSERLAMMDPDQRVEYLLAERGRADETRYARLEFQMQDSADRTAFEGLCARNSTAAKLKTEVEDRLAELRRNGTTAPRETVLKYVIGDRALANAPRAKTRAQNTADANRQRQTARPTGGRSDAGTPTGRIADDRAARAKRLEDQQI